LIKSVGGRIGAVMIIYIKRERQCVCVGVFVGLIYHLFASAMEASGTSSRAASIRREEDRRERGADMGSGIAGRDETPIRRDREEEEKLR
jgi:hypothetical protein